ncbi:glycerophosphodiester phosphodiesterase [Streptomyces aculeolatus]|uniref:glycerophosphodiester phosphodiesterase n=1 Tax=Streptomyces aculeolatus TaxID=270689 RepID=UPI001CEC5EE9|nr:glycerophosphodiester phosphodiesterase family protein [Streptomyces aculeolatus]
MARHLFGGVADYVIALGTDDAATLQPGASVTCWNAISGGSQHTDLLTGVDSTPIEGGTLTADSNGAVPEFFGPDGVTELYFDANAGGGPRRRAVATDLGSDISGVRADLDAHTAAPNPHGTELLDLDDVYDPSIANLIATTPFAIAHRGSGGEFPEHTLAAYTAALAAGAKAIEVSVHLTADGVPVCFHDTTLDRVTDHTGPIADWTYAALREQVRVTPQGLLGAGWADQPIPTLAEVLDALYGRCVIFLEAKSNPAIVPLRDFMLDRYPGCTRSVVWKAHYGQGGLADRAGEGWTVWAYMDAGTLDAALDAVDASVDMWGVPYGMTDTRIGDVVARGKPVICWEVHRNMEITRLTGLGVVGLMEAQWVYLNKGLTLAADLFDAQVTQPGTLGIANYSEDYAPKFDGAGGMYLNKVPNDSILMGGHKAPAADGYVISFAMKWDTVPAASQHSGVAFGKASDDKYQFSTANASGGYHALIRGNGDIQLYTHTAGVTTGTQLGTLATVAPVASTPMTFEIEVTSTQVILRRTDVGPYVLTVNNTAYRGRYWHVTNGSVTTLSSKPVWSNISVA